MQPKILTAVILGTGEKIVTNTKFGVGHEFVAALLDAVIVSSPAPHDPLLPIISEHYDSIPIAGSKPIAYITLSETNQYVVPSPYNHLGVNFTEKDLLVIYGVDPSIWSNIFSPSLVQQEILLKANAIAEEYFKQILASTEEEQIKLFVYGFSRGGCIAMQAMNILYKKINKHDSENNSKLLDKLDVNMFILDPVPGSLAIDNDPATHIIPAFVSKINFIYAEHEYRHGFLPLREFYKQSDKTIVEISTFPGNHATVKRIDGEVDSEENAPALMVTNLLTKQYYEFTNRFLAMRVYVRDAQGGISRVFFEIKEQFEAYSEQTIESYRALAKKKQKQYFGFFSPFLYADRKIKDKNLLEDIYVNWPTALKKLETKSQSSIEYNKFLPLIIQLQLLLKHSYTANNEQNTALICDNFQDCIEGIDLIMNNLEQSLAFKQGYAQLHEALENIKQNAINDEVLVKIILIALAVLATICTLGIVGLYFYLDESNNYFTTQAKPAYLAELLQNKLAKYNDKQQEVTTDISDNMSFPHVAIV